MKRIILWSIIGWLGVGCAPAVTPPPEVVAVENTATATLAANTPTPTSTPLPTSTPRPATPIPSPTVTPTATPIIYAVQSGDTLLSIAIAFETTTEIIQESNGIVDPRFLQIGQELIIPPPELNEDVPPTSSPTPLPLEIKAINFLETGQGRLWGLGEVHNPGDVPVSEVVVEASLLDDSGLLLAQEAAFTQLDVVQPGQAVPFAILFDTPPSSFAQYQVVPVTGVPISDQARYYFDLEIFETQGRPVGLSGYQVVGQLQNVGDIDAEAIRLVAVTYDAAGQMLAQRQADLAVTRLKPGAITPFEIELTVAQGVVADYRLVVQGLRVE